MPLVRIALLAVLLGAQSSSVPAPIERLLADFVTAFNAGDAARLASLYTDDAVWLPQELPMIRGRANIEATVRKSLERGGDIKLSVLTAEVSGDIGFAMGTFTVSRDGAPTLPAKFLTVFRRVGNEWKIAYDMQNADQPRPQP